MSPAAAAGKSCCCSPRSGSAERSAPATGAAALPRSRAGPASRGTASRTSRPSSAWPLCARRPGFHAEPAACRVAPPPPPQDGGGRGLTSGFRLALGQAVYINEKSAFDLGGLGLSRVLSVPEL